MGRERLHSGLICDRYRAILENLPNWDKPVILMVEARMDEFYRLEEIDEVTASVKKHFSIQPKVGLILGTGLGDIVNAVEGAETVSTSEIPGWPLSTVQGHQGKLVCGYLEGVPSLILQGRSHYYEGYSMAKVTLPVRVMQRLGVQTLVLTNAAGAIHPDFEPGDLMLITDQLNLIGMAGLNPLRGPNIDELGTRFPDMSRIYDRTLLDLARASAKENGINLQEGVYVCLAGPSFESPADLRFLKAAGADAVGMSTVPEAIVARHGGMRVLGISGISNKANLDGNTLTTHEEVLAAGQRIIPPMTRIIGGVLKKLPTVYPL